MCNNELREVLDWTQISIPIMKKDGQIRHASWASISFYEIASFIIELHKIKKKLNSNSIPSKEH